MKKPSYFSPLLFLLLLISGHAFTQTGPQYTSLSPKTIGLNGDTVYVHGSNFTKGSFVGAFLFNTAHPNATGTNGFKWISDTLLQFVAPTPVSPVKPGTYQLYIEQLKNATKDTLSDQLTYHLPVVSSISPDSCSVSGGDTITINGQYFGDITAGVNVMFGTVPQSEFLSISDNQIQVISPSLTQFGEMQLSVTVQSNPSDTNATTKINALGPIITSISPDSASVKGGDTITIKGNYFGSTTANVSVTFGNNGDKSILSVTPKEIKAVCPSYPGPKKVQVKVKVKSISSDTSANSRFTYISDAPDSIYTLSVVDSSGMDANYKVYVLGYSTGSAKMLTLNTADSSLSFTPMPVSKESGYVESYELGKDFNKIHLSNLNPITGARIYFFMAKNSETYKDNSDKTQNGNLGFKYSKGGTAVTQVINPPQSNFPQYNYIEATFLANSGLYIDVSTVDGFFFPLSVIAQDTSGTELDRIGQSGNSDITGAAITNAYKPFMDKLAQGGEPTTEYKKLSYKVNDEITALLNPGLYLANSNSLLETAFDSALNVIFTTDMNMQIWQNGKKGFGSAYYDVTPVSNQPFPGTTNKHDALQFTSPDKDTLYVFNPVGFSVISYLDTTSNTRKPIYGTIDNNVLTFETPLPGDVGLDTGMYLNSGGGSIEGLTQIKKINTNSSGQISSVQLDTSNNDQSKFNYKFAKAPVQYFMSSGQMVFAGSGLMADGPFRYPGTKAALKNKQTIINGLENQICTALNRGIALLSFDSDSTTKNWANEEGWYPKGQPQNYFSLFMHIAKVNGTHIFSLPEGKVKSTSRKEYMAKAYGFAYDENPIGGYHGPQVPSEFPGKFPKHTTKLKLVLGPWK